MADTGTMRDTVNSDVSNWELTIQDVLSIVLLAALACRAGNITVGPRTTYKMPILCQDDIVMKVKGETNLNNYHAIIVIRNEKG